MCEIKLSCVEVNCDTEKGGALLNIASHILDIVQICDTPPGENLTFRSDLECEDKIISLYIEFCLFIKIGLKGRACFKII